MNTTVTDPALWRGAYAAERAREYDRFIAACAMNYRGALDAVIEMARRGAAARGPILELGAGTGGLTSRLLEAFPDADVTAVDGSAEMLEMARAKLGDAGGRLTLRRASFEELGGGVPGGPYRLIVSSFALHHMQHPRLRELFARCREALAPGGRLVVADYVLSPDPDLQAEYEDVWVESRQRGMREQLGQVAEKAAVARLHEETKRAEGDNPAVLEDLLGWLKDARLRGVGCHWKYYCYAVYGGSR